MWRHLVIGHDMLSPIPDYIKFLCVMSETVDPEKLTIDSPLQRKIEELAKVGSTNYVLIQLKIRRKPKQGQLK